MSKVKRPLNRSIFIVCVVFVGLLCIISSLLLYNVYTNNMFKRYKAQLRSIVDFVESNIDHDDMANCAKTLVESEKYQEFQEFFDNMIDTYDDVHYMYILQLDDSVDGIYLGLICTANSTWEKENEPDMVLHLGFDGTDSYDYKVRKKFNELLKGNDEYYYYINKSEWGTDYTLVHPVSDSSGNRYGLLCADVDINDINSTIYKNTFINIGLIVGAGIIFIALLILWMRRNVTKPIVRLEKYINDFVASSADVHNPEDLKYIPPEIHTKNEVESLSRSYEKLSEEMREFIKGVVKAEAEAKGLKEHVNEMNAIAYKDPLTHVKNKTAYENKKELLTKDIEKNNARFGIVMADINSLKVINDKYGHEKGDDYIFGSCMIISQIYKHSPVYRIGGDEFVVVLQLSDYDNREELLELARNEFAKVMNDKTKDPWNRYSAAIGMSIWEKGDDVDTVFRRADKEMYVEKAKIKEKFKL